MVNLDQYLNSDMTAGDVAHSNGYAMAAGGAGAGGLSIEQRRRLLNQPRVISVYRHSRLGSQGSAIKSRTADSLRGRVYDASSDSFDSDARYANRQGGGIKDKRQINQKSVERRQKFIEPSPRKYDKFS